MCEQGDDTGSKAAGNAPRGADIHLIYNPFNPSQQAIISTARRLQEILLEFGALDGRSLPFPELAPDWYGVANDL